MSSKMIINVKDARIVVPDTGTPDTGMFSATHSDGVNSLGNMIAPIIGISLVTLMLIAVIVKICKGRKQKKNASFKIHSGRRLALRFGSVALVVLIAAFAVIKYNEKQDFVKAEGLIVDNELSLTTEDVSINVELGDEPVYAMSKSIVKVDTATLNGYTLMAYIDSDTADLKNETNAKSGSKISGLESTYSQALGENTWGVALTSPGGFDAPVFRGLPIGEKNAMTVKVTGSVATPANDITPLYYATYLVPGLDEGRYTGTTINYVAIANPTTDDITVNFNVRNEETDSEELFNTMVYGLDCALAYVGGNCQKAYAGESIMVASSAVMEPEPGQETPIQIEPVRVEGADILKMTLDYNMDFESSMLAIINGYYTDQEAIETAMRDLIDSGGRPEDFVVYISNIMGEDLLTDELYVDNDSVTIIFGRSIDSDNSFSAEITPIYLEEPSNITTTETNICRVVESGNLGSGWGDDGDIKEHLKNGIIYLGRSEVLRPVTVPGAKRVRVEVEYNFPERTMGLVLIEGTWDGNMDNLPEKYQQVGSMNQNESGVKTFDFDGDTVSFYVMNRMDNPQADDYGFTAKIYPLYDDETEGTEPTKTCKIVKKSGVYKEPVGFDGDWIVPLDFEGDDQPGRIFIFRGETDLESILMSGYDEFRGRTLDAYVIH